MSVNPVSVSSVFQLLDNYTGVCLFLNVGSTGVLKFFTVSSILVLWTEEVSGRCPETREGRLPLDPHPLTG